MQTVLPQLAVILSYPTEEASSCLDVALASLGAACPDAAIRLSEWGRYFRETPLWQVQETYTQTFDLNPVCGLDVGYYLFGEDYQRGIFLAHLRESQEEIGMVEETELPDHLPVLLRWLARVYGTELYTDMAAECVVPVVRRMDESLAAAANPYRNLLQAIARVLEDDLSRAGVTIPDRRFRKPDLIATGSPAGAVVAPRRGCLAGDAAMALEGVPILSADAGPCGGMR
jgi:nitrate reductase delta subunit